MPIDEKIPELCHSGDPMNGDGDGFDVLQVEEEGGRIHNPPNNLGAGPRNDDG